MDKNQEFAAVVRVQPQQRERQEAACHVELLQDSLLAAVEQRQAFRPASGHIGQHEAVEVASFRAGTTMRDEVRLHKTGARKTATALTALYHAVG